MKARYLDRAKLELLDVIASYETARPGLGLEFALEVDRRIEHIEQFPLASTILEDNVRLVMTRRFPYGLVYRIVGEEAVVLSVFHLHREPGVWKRRLQE